MRSRFLSVLLLVVLLIPDFPARADGLPDLGEASQGDLSPSMERKIGEATMRDIRANEPSYVDDPEVTGYLNRVGHSLTSQISGGGQEFQFFVLRDPTLNAFAMPGGYIGVHTGLIVAAQSESELASVLGHEISHVTQHHLARMAAKQREGQWAALAAMLAALAAARSNPDAAMGAAMAGQAGAIQNQLNYSRDFEREADRLGLQLLDKAGYDVRGMTTFFERLLKETRLYDNNAPSYLSTHPLTTERIADIATRTQLMHPHPVADSLDFTLVRAKLEAATGTPVDAVTLFQTQLREHKFKSEAAAHYGLTRAYLRANNVKGAQAQMAQLRRFNLASPMVETLAAELQTQAGDNAGAINTLREARNRFPDDRATVYAYLEALLAGGKADEAARLASDDVMTHTTDAQMRILQAKAYAAQGKQFETHWAQGEAYALQGRTMAAIEQLNLAQKSEGGDFYGRSQIDVRLRQLQAQLMEERKERKQGDGP